MVNIVSLSKAEAKRNMFQNSQKSWGILTDISKCN